jgi:hypothetical protein
MKHRPEPLSDAQAAALRTLIAGFTFVLAVRTRHHEYTVRTAENEADYFRLFRAIRAHGVNERFAGRTYRYLRVGDCCKYWAMTSLEGQSRIINRARIEGG